MKNRKILEIISDLNTGGAEVLLKSLCLQLIKQDLNVSVLVLSDKGKMYKEFLDSGIEVINLNCRYSNSLIKFIKMLFAILKFRPTVVHTHLNVADRYGILASFLCGVKKRIMTAHNMEPERKKLDPITCNIVSWFATDIVAVSDAAKNMYIEKRIYPEKKLKTIYNSPGFEDNEEVLAKTIEYNNELRLINVGKLSVQKGHINLLNAMKILKERGVKARLDIFGSNEAYKDYAYNVISFIENEELENVKYCGVTNNLLTELKKSDIFISTSLWEGMPLAPLEAMAAGLPCILSNIEPHMEIINIEDYQKYTVSPEKPEETANMIEKIVNNKELYTRLSQLGLKRAEKYSIKSMVDGYKKLFGF